jgi:hypothetical protein
MSLQQATPPPFAAVQGVAQSAEAAGQQPAVAATPFSTVAGVTRLPATGHGDDRAPSSTLPMVSLACLAAGAILVLIGSRQRDQT